MALFRVPSPPKTRSQSGTPQTSDIQATIAKFVEYREFRVFTYSSPGQGPTSLFSTLPGPSLLPVCGETIILAWVSD